MSELCKANVTLNPSEIAVVQAWMESRDSDAPDLPHGMLEIVLNVDESPQLTILFDKEADMGELQKWINELIAIEGSDSSNHVIH